MIFKEYEILDGKRAVFEYDENGVGKITLECMDMLMGQLIAYKRCIQSRSFWDAKHCDGCMFYDDCPFDPREEDDEPQTEPNCSEIPNNCEPQTYVINPQEPTNDDKCFECDDFFTCGGQCNKCVYDSYRDYEYDKALEQMEREDDE